MALRKAFKYFDADASGDIDPDEFFAAMCSFGLEFTEDQVLALFGYYDVDRDGGLSYYEFIEKVHTLIHSEVECPLAECHPFPSYSLLLFITMCGGRCLAARLIRAARRSRNTQCCNLCQSQCKRRLL